MLVQCERVIGWGWSTCWEWARDWLRMEHLLRVSAWLVEDGAPAECEHVIGWGWSTCREWARDWLRVEHLLSVSMWLVDGGAPAESEHVMVEHLLCVSTWLVEDGAPAESQCVIGCRCWGWNIFCSKFSGLTLPCRPLTSSVIDSSRRRKPMRRRSHSLWSVFIALLHTAFLIISSWVLSDSLGCYLSHMHVSVLL